MELTTVHITLMLITLALVIGAGIYSAKSVKSAEGYSLGGRSASAYMVAGSIAGTVVGGGATVGTAQLAFSTGLSAWWFTLGSGIAFIIMGLFYAKTLRSTGLETIPQYLKRNYGSNAATVAGIVSSVGILFSAVASCLPGIQLTATILNVNLYEAAAIFIAIIIAYTSLGGMKGAGIGGILKTAIIWITLLIAGVTAWQSLCSMPDFHQQFPSMPWFSMLGRGWDSALYSLFSMIVGVICTQTYIQCIFSASDPRTASIGTFVAAAIVIPVGLPSVAVGMYMQAFAPDTLPVLVLPVYLTQHMPEWLGGIALGGIMLSLIGSIGGLAMGIGTMLSRDIVQRFVEIKSQAGQLRTMRLMVVLVLITACGIAIVNIDSQVLFWNFMSMALRGGGVFIPLSLAIFSPRSIAKKWAVGSMIISTVIAVVSGIFNLFPIAPLFVGLLVSGGLCLVGYVKRWRPV